MLALHTTLAILAATATVAVGRQCYQCGYQVVDNGTPMPLPGLPECFEDATLQSHKVECEGGDECCGSVREWIDISTAEKNSTMLIGRHDCEQKLVAYEPGYGVLCNDHTDECVDIDRESLPEGHNETMLRARVCYCSTELCNYHIPGLETSAAPSPPSPTPAGKTCYNCGYRRLPGGEFEQLPDLPLCDDFAKPTDITKQCADPECCGDIKEEFTRVDEDTGEKSTVIVGRHGCESDITHYIGNDAPLCADHTDSCFNMDHSTLPNHNDNNVTITNAEICFCSTDRCNNADHMPPAPTTPAPGNGAAAVLGCLATTLAALLLAY